MIDEIAARSAQVPDPPGSRLAGRCRFPPGTASILPGITIEASADVGPFSVAISAALVLGIVNLFIRPIILLLARSLGFIAILLVGLFVNAIALMITANLIPELQISSWWYAFLGGLIFSVINTIITNLMTIDDDDSFYAGLIERKARKEPIFKETAGEDRAWSCSRSTV